MAFKMKGFSAFTRKTDPPQVPLPPDPDREDGGFETDEEYRQWLKKHNITKTDVKNTNKKKNLSKGYLGKSLSQASMKYRSNYDEVD